MAFPASRPSMPRSFQSRRGRRRGLRDRNAGGIPGEALRRTRRHPDQRRDAVQPSQATIGACRDCFLSGAPMLESRLWTLCAASGRNYENVQQ